MNGGKNTLQLLANKQMTSLVALNPPSCFIIYFQNLQGLCQPKMPAQHLRAKPYRIFSYQTYTKTGSGEPLSSFAHSAF